jgi:hypothetical protein
MCGPKLCNRGDTTLHAYGTWGSKGECLQFSMYFLLCSVLLCHPFACSWRLACHAGKYHLFQTAKAMYWLAVFFLLTCGIAQAAIDATCPSDRELLATPSNCRPPRTIADASKPFCYVPPTISPEAQQFLATVALEALRAQPHLAPPTLARPQKNKQLWSLSCARSFPARLRTYPSQPRHKISASSAMRASQESMFQLLSLCPKESKKVHLPTPRSCSTWHFTTSLDRSLTNYQASYVKLLGHAPIVLPWCQKPCKRPCCTPLITLSRQVAAEGLNAVHSMPHILTVRVVIRESSALSDKTGHKYSHRTQLRP